MSFEIHPIAHGKGFTTNRCLLWRSDSKQWDIGRIDPNYIGNPNYAYTHWCYLPFAPGIALKSN